MKPRLEWVKLPSDWIEENGLRRFRWRAKAGNENANNIAALLTLLAIAHHASPDEGQARLTYNDLERILGLSRAKLAGGLAVLETHGIIERNLGRSYYQLIGFDPSRGWAKLPCKVLYSGDRMKAFQDFHLRKPTELDALKLYLLFASRRGNDTNMANISYDRIVEYTAINREFIKPALSLLSANRLIHVEHQRSMVTEKGVSSAYRLSGLEPRKHMGTTGRRLVEFMPVDEA